jgi:tetratricopeptide (TPR) repeat protein
MAPTGRNNMRAVTATLALLALLAATTATSADSAWRMMTTEHYRVISQLNDRDTVSWVRNYDQFILSTSSVLRISPKSLPALTVILFRRDKDYEPYKITRPDGRAANVAGQFVSQPSWSAIGTAGQASADTRHTIFHEGTHWLMSVDRSAQPAWFSEGIAEMFATFEQVGDKVNWAKPISYHLTELDRGALIPLRDFLTASGAIFNSDRHTERFYAQSWAFVHFLMLSGNADHRERLFRFLNLYKTQSAEATVQAVFGDQLDNLQKEFDAYTERRSFAYMVQPKIAAPEPPAPQPAPPVIVEAALGFLALGSDRIELARTHATRAIALDNANPGGHEILAYLAAREQRLDQATASAAAAVQHGSRHADMFLIMGDSYAGGGPNADKPAAEKQRVAFYERAINLDGHRLEAYGRLAEALFELEQPRDEDRKFLENGLRIFPGEAWIKVGLATVSFHLNDRAAARSVLDEALRPESNLDDNQRSYARNLRRSWIFTELNEAMAAAVGRRDLVAARTTLNDYRQRLADDAEAAAFLDEADRQLTGLEQSQRRRR